VAQVRAALVSDFEVKDLGRILDVLDEVDLPADVDVHLGSYGIRRETSDLIHGRTSRRYSPIFQTSRTAAWNGRQLTPDEEALVDPRFRGAVPSNARLLELSSNQRIYWGVEVGRRHRDELRHARDAGTGVDSWQLDELSHQVVAAQGPLHREFMRGVMRGLAFGRPALGDEHEQGWIWATRGVLRLAAQAGDNEQAHFWRMLDQASFRVVGEEYPNFVGDPARSARRHSAGQRALAGGGPVRRRLARKYVAGLTPGYHLGGGLGGNVDGLSRAAAVKWRNAYVDARAREGVTGFAQFYVRFENARTTVMRDALQALARGMAEV
jgi:hypothetical protein